MFNSFEEKVQTHCFLLTCVMSKKYFGSIVFNIFEGKVVDLCAALSKILDGKILSLILVICGKKEDNATIYQVTEIKQKQSSL